MIKFQWVHCDVFLPLAHIICACEYVRVILAWYVHTYMLHFEKCGPLCHMFWSIIKDKLAWVMLNICLFESMSLKTPCGCWCTCCLQRHCWFYVQKVSQMCTCLRAFYDDVCMFGRSKSILSVVICRPLSDIASMVCFQLIVMLSYVHMYMYIQTSFTKSHNSTSIFGCASHLNTAHLNTFILSIHYSIHQLSQGNSLRANF